MEIKEVKLQSEQTLKEIARAKRYIRKFEKELEFLKSNDKFAPLIPPCIEGLKSWEQYLAKLQEISKK